jgi:serine/threonine protein kinase
VTQELEPPEGARVLSDALEMDWEEIHDELPAFEIEKQLSHTAMSTVWLARETVLDRPVAIKLLRNLDGDPAFVERFIREARVMAKLKHPNIVVIHSFGRTKSRHCYLVMEYVGGSDLTHHIRRRPMELARALSVATSICDALHEAHRLGFVHRDIKPGNVLISEKGEVKVTDFGLTRLSRDRETDTLSITKAGHALGTPQYMAPEQASGQGKEDHRADIFSLGVVLYEMLTGEVPRGVFQPPSAKVKCGFPVDRIVMRALNEEPDQRQPSIAALREEIHRIRLRVDPSVLGDHAEWHRQTRVRRLWEMLLGMAVATLLGMMAAWYARPYLEAIFDN